MGATLSARALRRAMGEFREALRAHRDELDSLNVFPVPDGDTGTNLLLTQEAVVDALEEVAADDLAAVSEAVTRAALMGARGNSGVILSQILRGLCEGLSRSDDLASALEAASERAHQAVAEPVEGTMLTVLRDAAAAARGAGDGSDGAARAAAALREALAALERTRDQLPPLREAGVVDAGARGVVLLLDSVAAAIQNSPRTVEVGPGGPIGRRSARTQTPTRYGYETMYLLECENGALPRLRERLEAIGDSVAVVGAAGLFNVHVHTDDPGGAVEAGLDAGRPRGIRIASLDEQVARTCVAHEARAVRVPEVGGAAPATAEVGMVAVAPAPGLADLFRSLGAIAVADLSKDGLVRAVEAVPAEAVLVVTADPAAELERAAGRAPKPFRIVPAGSAVAAIAAAAAFAPEASLHDNARAAARAAERVVAAEVRTDGGAVVGMVGGRVREKGSDPVAVAVKLCAGLCGDGHEVLTILAGEGATEGDLRRVREELTDRLPFLEVEAHRGDQPGSVFAIGIE